MNFLLKFFIFCFEKINFSQVSKQFCVALFLTFYYYHSRGVNYIALKVDEINSIFAMLKYSDPHF